MAKLQPAVAIAVLLWFYTHAAVHAATATPASAGGLASLNLVGNAAVQHRHSQVGTCYPTASHRDNACVRHL
jgi:hypothetical protein